MCLTEVVVESVTMDEISSRHTVQTFADLYIIPEVHLNLLLLTLRLEPETLTMSIPWQCLAIPDQKSAIPSTAATATLKVFVSVDLPYPYLEDESSELEARFERLEQCSLQLER